MPANLPPQYYAARKRFELSKDPEEKLEILQEMLSIMPKHKGTDKLQAEVRSKIAAFRKEVQKSRSKRKRYDGYHIVRQGAAQIALVGAPNVGKSSLLANLTNAVPDIASYPFTTTVPLVGMMPFEDINIQLIDTPPVSADFIDKFLPDMLKNVDLILLVIDIGSDDVLEQMETTIEKLSENKVNLTGEEIHDQDGQVFKKTLVAANKTDMPESKDRLEILNEFYSGRFTMIPVSAQERSGLDSLKKEIYDALGIIRVYTKSVGKKADLTDPVILKAGSTVLEAAAVIHKEFSENLRFAKIWGSGNNKYDGQRVSRDHTLGDRNIVEFHISE